MAVQQNSTRSKPTIAQVKVLRAEVRVLMVGSRQITLSVFRQLDVVNASELEWFGRVRDPQRHDDCATGFPEDTEGDRHVIGRHRFTGALTRTNINRECWWTVTLQHELDLCRSRMSYEIASRHRYEQLRTFRDGSDGSKQQWIELVDRYNALPLIILAGLT